MTLVELTPRVASSDRLTGLPVLIIGAGPTGLAAAVNLAHRGIDFLVLESGHEAGAAVRRWGHIALFSPWRYAVDPASRRLLEASGWVAPHDDDRSPTGHELVDEYLAPLSRLDALRSRIRYGTRVVAVSRLGMDRTRSVGRDVTPFLVRVQSSDGEVEELLGRAVIDASGTYDSPNPLLASGLQPSGIEDAEGSIIHALPDVLGADRATFTGRHTTVVGAGHSAANTLIALAQLAAGDPKTRVTWMIRNASAIRITAASDDALPDRAQLGSRIDRLVAEGLTDKIDSFEISGVHRRGEGVRLVGRRRGDDAVHDTDLVVAATGFRPDLGMLREMRLRLDEIVEAPVALAPLIDPNLHTCGTVAPHGFDELRHPESGFFIVGMKSYGRAPTFLLPTGYEQVRSVAAWIDGDMRAATAVQLTLPATGVCSTDAIGAGSCCA